MNAWPFLVKLCFRQHFCTSGRRHPTLWQLFMRASRAVSFMSCPHLRSENILPQSDSVKVDLNLVKQTIYSLSISCRPCKTPRTSWLIKRGRTKLKQMQKMERNPRPQMISECNIKKYVIPIFLQHVHDNTEPGFYFTLKIKLVKIDPVCCFKSTH